MKVSSVLHNFSVIMAKRYSADEALNILLNSDNDPENCVEYESDYLADELSSDDDSDKSEEPETDSESENGDGNANPSNISQLLWGSASTHAPNLPDFAGNAEVDLHLIDAANFTPLDYFRLFANDDLMRHIAIQTNTYAEQFFEAKEDQLLPHSRARKWKVTDKYEIRRFLGLPLLMGIVQKPSIAMY